MQRRPEKPSKKSRPDSLSVSEKEKHRQVWEKRILRTYRLTVEEVAWKWEHQGGACPICSRPLGEVVKGKPKVWVIDHDHKTKNFRGILCAWCNHRIVSMIERGGSLRWANAGVYLGYNN